MLHRAFKRNGLLPLGRFTFIKYTISQRLHQDTRRPNKKLPSPLCPALGTLIVSEKCRHARCAALDEGISNGLPDTQSKRNQHSIGDGLPRLWDTSSNDAIANETFRHLVATHSYRGATVVCLTGEVNAAIHAIRNDRRCRVLVSDRYEMDEANRQLETELRRRSEAATS